MTKWNDSLKLINGPQLTESVKLLIWDLDDTYWAGTLSEGPIEMLQENRDMVRVLNRRGIVNAICSKNDHEAVRARLELEGDWEEFVFASIDWTPKGPRIANLIESMGLRPVNVLFVDDNHVNLNEAEYYSPGIQTIDPRFLQAVFGSAQLKGKDDSSLSRLTQYRALESKMRDKIAMGVSNEEFLRASEIRVGINYDCLAQIERLLELVNRSNQLNYTKARFSRVEFEELLMDDSVSSGYVTVRDKYGDHGICGFFATRENKAICFTFSCRILSMGVENWVHRELGAPSVSVVGEVATSLDSAIDVDWITHDDVNRVTDGPRESGSKKGEMSTALILLKGGCDLSVVAEHLGGRVETEFTFPSETGALVHQEHTEILKRSFPITLEHYGDVIDRLPFLERAAYQSAIVESPKSYDSIVYSVLMDYTQGLYRYQNTDFVVPFGEFSIDATVSDNQGRYTKRLGEVGFDREFFSWFSQNFRFEGPMTPERIRENVKWLRTVIPPTVRLVILNGAEVPSPSPLEPDRHEHHIRCNIVLEEVVRELENTVISDVRLVVSEAHDLTNNIRHYSRKAYFDLASQLAADIAVPGIKRKSRFAIGARKSAGSARGFLMSAGGKILRHLRHANR